MQFGELENTPETVDSTQSSTIGLSPGEYSVHRLLAIIACSLTDTSIEKKKANHLLQILIGAALYGKNPI